MTVDGDSTLVRFDAPKSGHDEFFVLSLQGREAMSQLYEFRVLVLPGESFELADAPKLLIGPVALAFGEDDHDKVRGVVRAYEIIPDPHSARVQLMLSVVPRLWYLTQSGRSRVFLDKSVPDIVKAVLTEAKLSDGTDFEFHLTGRHAVRAYTVQYQETEFQFISRLMEHAGLFYFFEHTDSGDKIVIADSNKAFVSIPDHEFLPFHPIGGAVDESDSITDLRCTQSVVAKTSIVRDYNPGLPSKVITNPSAAPIDDAGWDSARIGDGVRVFEGEQAITESEADRLAALRAEEVAVPKATYTGRSTARRLHPGSKFDLEQHGLESFNQKYFVAEVDHSVDQSGFLSPGGGGDASSRDRAYGNDFVCHPFDTPYRAPRLTPKPRIFGAVPARIDGEADNTVAPIDADGCYRVVIPFDVAGAVGGKASCPIRMVQPYAGPGYGMHFPLHKGADVLLIHIDGDPDRPVIMGSVPNPQTASPVTSPHGTRSVLQTRSSIRIEFEDDA